MLAKKIVMAVGALALMAGCKKTVEGETKNWTAGLERVQQLSALYPGFAPALAAQKTQAEAAMKSAESVGDGEAKAKAMAAANDLLTGGFVYQLGAVDSKVKRLRDRIVAANSSTMDPNDRMAARAATTEAERTLGEVEQRMRDGASDPSAARAILGRVDSDLQAATATVERVVDASKKKQAEAQKAAAGGATAGAAGGAAKPAQKVTWKCKFCQHQNDEARKKCENCGAPRP